MGRQAWQRGTARQAGGTARQAGSREEIKKSWPRAGKGQGTGITANNRRGLPQRHQSWPPDGIGVAAGSDWRARKVSGRPEKCLGGPEKCCLNPSGIQPGVAGHHDSPGKIPALVRALPYTEPSDEAVVIRPWTDRPFFTCLALSVAACKGGPPRALELDSVVTRQ